MKIQLISDIHLEFADFDIDTLSPQKDITLIIAGDLSSNAETSVKFLEECGKKYREVFFVLGNHDFYSRNIKQTIEILETKLSNIDNVSMLDNKYLIREGILFFGTTLWSIPDKYLANNINDYRCIFKDSMIGTISTEIITDLFYRNLGQLSYLLSRCCRDVVVITHNCPSMKAIHKDYIGNGLNSFFAVDIDFLMKQYDNIKYWFFGHTHKNIDIKINKTRLLCNPRGYCDENKEFNKKLIIEI